MPSTASNRRAEMNTYRATVKQGRIEFTTYVAGKTAKQAKARLVREGFEVLALWVLELAA